MKSLKVDGLSVGDLSVGDLSVGGLSLDSKEDALKEFLEKPDLTEAAQEEIGEQLAKIKEFEKKFKDRWAFEGDGGYFFSICFESKKQRDAFLKRHKLKLVHDDHIMYTDIEHLFEEA